MRTLAHASPKPKATPEYSLHRVLLSENSSNLFSDWKSFLRQCGSNTPMHDPDWLKAQFTTQLETVSVYLLYQSGSICGVVPVVKGEWPVKWQVGEVTVARLPVKRLRVLGGAPNFPDDKVAWDLLFDEFASATNDIQAVYLESIPISSCVWSYLRESAVVRRCFRRYSPGRPARHALLHLCGSFQDYLGGFSPKHRKNVLREVRRLKEGTLGQMQFRSYANPEEVPTFVQLAATVCRKTWQWNLLGEGICGDTNARTRLLTDLAAQGWLRSYILICGDVPVAYVVGYQYRDRFLFQEFGFDPEYSRESVGTVLFVLMIEDLFIDHRTAVMDLGGYAKYKEAFTKDGYLEGTVFLFRPGIHTLFVQTGLQACQLVSRAGSTVLDKIKCKEKIRKRIRQATL